MPEYLAPAVYVEEVDTGSKPIEGVSTSTTGMVGVTERGPVGVPILVTSFGEYQRWFGGMLSPDLYTNNSDPAHPDRMCFLPHAVEGFFLNGGKRLFVTRVLDTATATRASQPMFDRGDEASIATVLLRPVTAGTGSAASPPGLVILPVAGPNPGDWLRIGDGSDAEFRRAAGPSVAEDVMIPLHLPLSRGHAGAVVRQYTRATLAGTYTLADAAPARSPAIVVRGTHADIALLAVNECLEIDGATTGEYRIVRETAPARSVSATDSTVRLVLDAPLHLEHAATAAGVRIDLATPQPQTATVETARAGSALVFVDARGGSYNVRTDLVEIQGAGREVRRIGDFTEVPITHGAYTPYPAGSLVAAVTIAADVRQLAAALAGGGTETTITLNNASGLVPGQQLRVGPAGPTQEVVTVQQVNATTNVVTVTPAINNPHANGEDVRPLERATTGAAAAGSRVLPLDNRLGLAVGDVLVIGTGPAAQYVIVAGTPAAGGTAPDPGNVVVQPALAPPWPGGTPVVRQAVPVPVGGRQQTALAIAAPAGAQALLLSDGNGFAQNEFLRVTTPGGDVAFHGVPAAPSTPVAEVLELQSALTRAHAEGSMTVGRDPLFDVQALDAGIWGNRLRISVEDEQPGLVSRATLAQAIDPRTIRLSTATGVQTGTVLEFFDPVTQEVLGPPVKVAAVDRTANYTIHLAANLQPAQTAPGVRVRSREFRLTVYLLRQPDPAVPVRDGQAIDREDFRYLSMDPRHSNYIERTIGAINGPLRLADRRPEGNSGYVRVADRAAVNDAMATVRLGPEMMVDILPDGRSQPARHALETVRGLDSIDTLSDDHFVGDDDPQPENRTGLQTLRNVEELSIIGAPGRTSPAIQNALISHCELLRYRFAVLDGAPPPRDALADIQAQRAQFDTKYAALYYPWLLIPHPYPATPGLVQDYPVPPSGHMLGIYARTDVERGVHKAPANEVVRGVTGLQRVLNKEQHDILNPYPVNINVIRDFRPNNRGIRVYGGRVITSDSDWKYVNVRRLLIFIEASVDRGLQWVVFEPNEEPLWARVRRAITNFLTLVWRNGALEGTKVEEAFFVKCDRTTMTQTDIDQGRLICLVGVAPVKPAEFVIVRIGLWTAHAEE